jgi:two-component system response regulator ChvI
MPTAPALKALLDNPPDLAVFDIKMPRMDGLELLQRLREKSALPVIFLTSKDEEPDEALGLAMGGRLHHQALQPAPAGRAHPRHPAPSGRAPRRTRPSGEPAPDIIHRGRLAMDPARHEVTWTSSRFRSPSPNS